ncbi:MAG: ABC transporter ATP-binding protein [Clostridiales bacterium]|nr:ABC transporter ATP-binding protein [Clostridiales bacterium]
MPNNRGLSTNPNDKAKNFSESLKRLLKELKSFKIIIIISLILAIFGSIFSIIAPKRLAKLVDEISKGLVVNTQNIQELEKQISINQLQKNVIIDGKEISVPDQIKTMQVMQTLNQSNGTNAKDLYSKIEQLPQSVQEIIKPKMNIENIKKITIILVVIYILSSLFTYFEQYLMAETSNRFAENLRKRISQKINKLPLKYFDKNQTGDILSRVTNDVDTVAQTLNQSLATLVSAVVLFFGTLIMMFYTNWIMAITAVLSVMFGFIFMGLVLAKSQKYFAARQTELGKLNSHVEEVYSNLVVVKAYNGQKESSEKFDNLNENVYEANRKSQFISGLMMPMMQFVGNFGYVAVCIVGALLANSGKITFGVIVEFMTYVRLFSSPLSQIAQSFTSMQSTAAASERVFEFLDEEELPKENAKEILSPEEVKGNISFEHVYFGYDKTRDIIKDFTVNVKPGQKIAIVGPTGAGKTTIVNLLMKFYEINSGDIKIECISTKDLSRENIASLFTMVLQDTWLFEGTIRENIAFNREHLTDEEIYAVCDKIGITHFIKSLPEGLNTQINENDSISAGQKQLITIARGMLEKTPFLILDEATSNVDTRTEELVQKAMDKLTEGRTSFIIAHRLSTIKNADIILVMNDGNIIEQGNHEELMKKDGFYAKLYNSQFEL